MAAINLRQPYDLVETLGQKVEGVMKTAVTVAEDMQVRFLVRARPASTSWGPLQEEGEQCAKQVDRIEQYLLDFAKLSEDVNLRKQALDHVLTASTEMPEEEVDRELSLRSNHACLCLHVGTA